MEPFVLVQVQKPPWSEYVDYWGNTASVLGFLLAIIAFPITWRIQAKIRNETRKAMQRVAWLLLKEALEHVLVQLASTKEAARTVVWQRAFDCCEAARRGALGTLGNPHLTDDEKAQMRAHADNLSQVLRYIETNKLVQDPPAAFQASKKTVLDEMESFVTTIQIRLNAQIWEA